MLDRDVLPVLEHILLFINLKLDNLGSKSSLSDAEMRQTETTIKYPPWFPANRQHAHNSEYFFSTYIHKILTSLFDNHLFYSLKLNPNRQSRKWTEVEK